jgi:hypothetical protein
MAVTIDGTAGITFPNSTTQAVAGAPLTTPSFTTTIGVGAATASASGAGITFPATQSASSNANTLDDYEEGTWTPAVTQGLTSPTYSFQAGTYTKIGRLVNFGLQTNVASSTRNSSQVQISLPFTVASSGNSRAFGGYWTYVDTNIFSSSTTNLATIYIENGTSYLLFYSSTGAPFVGTDIATSTPSLYICGSFITET